MKRLSIWGGVIALLTLQACENRLPETTDTELPANEVTFTSTIDDFSASRAYDKQWEPNDRIGVFMMKSGTDEPLAENISYITPEGDGKFIKDGQGIAFPEEGSAVDFVAYYPYDGDAADHTDYPVDVSNQNDQSAIDLMASNNLKGRNIGNLSTGNNLQFKHMLSKLVLKLTPDKGESLAGIQITVLDVASTAMVNFRQQLILNPNGEKDIAMHVNDEGTQAEAVLIPQTLSGKLKVRLKINGKSKEVETKITTLGQGNKYTCNLTVKNAGNGISVDPEAENYVKWTETPVITKAIMDRPEIKYISHDVNGNEISTSATRAQTVRNYSILYDTNLKIALWVAYPLCSYYLDGDGKRTDEWGYDPGISTDLQANLRSGFKGGYDRGHQIPSADRLRNNTMNRTTFYYTNMTPQLGDFNQKIWANLENAVRGWCSGTDTLFVVTGAMPTTDTDTNIKYTQDNDGKNVAVPKYYFKALARKVQGKYQTIAFKLDHKKYSDQDYTKYAISVNKLEEITGFNFFPQIDEKAEDNSTAWK